MNIKFDPMVGKLVIAVALGVALVVGLPLVLTNWFGMSEIPANAIGIGLGFVAVLVGVVLALFGPGKSA